MQGMPAVSALDGLSKASTRPGGNVLREDVRASALFTNAFLPQYPLRTAEGTEAEAEADS